MAADIWRVHMRPQYKKGGNPQNKPARDYSIGKDFASPMKKGTHCQRVDFICHCRYTFMLSAAAIPLELSLTGLPGIQCEMLENSITGGCFGSVKRYTTEERTCTCSRK